MKKKVLLLNPPGGKKYIREYYCSKTTKSNYLLHPIDLLITSGWLKEKYDLTLIDAIADNLSPENCKQRILSASPDFIIFLAGSVSLEEDYHFLLDLSKNLSQKVKLIGSGDIFLERGEDWLKRWPFIDAILLSFFNGDILHYLEGRYEKLQSFIYRDSNGIKIIERKPQGFKNISFPIPCHEIFQNKNYQCSFHHTRNFATVLTDFGCIFNCSFCVMAFRQYYYRSSQDILDELQYIKRLGIEEIFFYDQTFGVNKKRLREICEGMILKDFKFGWVCYCRPDLVNRDMLRLMKKAGCHTVIMGVESADSNILSKYNKGYSLAQIRRGFKEASSAGLITVGTFILGLPEDTKETCENTILFAKKLGCDYASYNLAVPRMSTDLRKDAIQAGLIKEDFVAMDQAGATIAMKTRQLTKKELNALHKKAIFSFYMRPSFIFKRLQELKNFSHFKKQFLEGIALLKNVYRK